MPENKKEQVLSVRDLDITFKTTAGPVHAIRGVNIDLYKGETVALVGESGSGKSVTMKAAMGILAKNATVNSGSIQFSYHHADGSPETVDLLQKDKKWIRRHINGKRIAMVFQDPMTSLDPTMTIGKQIMEGMLWHFKMPKAEAYKKALELLELLNRSRVPMTLQALSQASGYPKSTIHSLLATLRSYGCIRQESDGRYYLGTKLFEWGCGVSAAWEITRCARPHLERLAQQTQYTALLSCVEGSDIVVIDQRVSGTGIQVASEIGGRTPLHATSQGKLLLSQLPDATVRYLMNGQGMDPFTPHTIVTLPDLLEELEHIRRKGCAIENGEYKIGLRSVSAPVFDREGQMRYTLTVVGLFRHVASGEFEEAVDMVCAAAGSLSRELGYHA